MHSPIPINEAACVDHAAAGKAIARRNLAKWIVDERALSAAHEQHKQQIDGAISRLDRVAAMLGVL